MIELMKLTHHFSFNIDKYIYLTAMFRNLPAFLVLILTSDRTAYMIFAIFYGHTFYFLNNVIIFCRNKPQPLVLRRQKWPIHLK